MIESGRPVVVADASGTAEGVSVRLTSSQALVRYLQRQYSERDGRRQRLIAGMFGIFGHGNVAGLGQALAEEGGDLRYFQPRNEQSMVHTAIGYAKAKNLLSTMACASSIGPGSTNLVTGAAAATVNRVPVLLLPADYYATRRQGPVLQQIEHPVSIDVSVNDTLRPVSRFFDRISRPEQILETLPEAMRALTDPAETGAVTISLPQDVQTEAYSYPASFFRERTWRIERRAPDERVITAAIAMLRDAARPFIIAGGGVHYSEAWDELRAFAESFGIPVGETFVGRGSIRDGSGLLTWGAGVTGTSASTALMRDADLVICVGTRLTDFTTGSRGAFGNPDVRFIAMNVSARDANKMGAHPIVADAREALRALLRAGLAAAIQPNGSYLAEIARLRDAWLDDVAHEVNAPHPGELPGQGELIGILNQQARRGDVVIAAAGSPPADLHKLWDASSGREIQMEFGFSCMGYEIPAGLGARLARAEGEVYVVIGDGTYLMNPTEIVTAAQEGLNVTIIVFENHGFQAIRQLQVGKTGSAFGNEFRHRDAAGGYLTGPYVSVDYAKNAESLGAQSWHVTTAEDFCLALRAAREHSGPKVIVVQTEPHRYTPASGMFWDVAPPEHSEDPEVQRRRGMYDLERRSQRYLG